MDSCLTEIKCKCVCIPNQASNYYRIPIGKRELKTLELISIPSWQ